MGERADRGNATVAEGGQDLAGLEERNRRHAGQFFRVDRATVASYRDPPNAVRRVGVARHADQVDAVELSRASYRIQKVS